MMPQPTVQSDSALLAHISNDSQMSALLIASLIAELGISKDTIIRMLREGITEELEAVAQVEMMLEAPHV